MDAPFADARATLDEAWACTFGELQTNGFSPHAEQMLRGLRQSHLRAFDMVTGDGDFASAMCVEIDADAPRPTLTLIR